jgi:hypothetical protein
MMVTDVGVEIGGAEIPDHTAQWPGLNELMQRRVERHPDTLEVRACSPATRAIVRAPGIRKILPSKPIILLSPF